MCDNPRVKAQLEETARQFSTVTSVKYFINGQPLDAALSEVTAGGCILAVTAEAAARSERDVDLPAGHSAHFVAYWKPIEWRLHG